MKTEAAPAATEEVRGWGGTKGGTLGWAGAQWEIFKLQPQAGVLGKIGMGSEREIITYLLNQRTTNIKSSASSTLMANP